MRKSRRRTLLLQNASAPSAAASTIIAGGRVFTAASAARVDYGSPAALENLCQSGYTLALVVARITSDATNQHFLQKSSATTTRGMTMLVGTRPGGATPRHLRCLIGTTGFRYDVAAGNADGVNQIPSNQHSIFGFMFTPGSNPKLYLSAFETKITEATNYTDVMAGSSSGAPGADTGDNLALFNTSTGSLSPAGDGSWVVLYKRATIYTDDDRWTIQQGLLAFTAGDITRGIAMMKSVSGHKLLSFTSNAGTVTDYGDSAFVATPSLGATTPGATLNSDSSGASLNKLFSLVTWEDDTQPGFSPDNREQTTYRYTSSHAQKRFTTTATSVTIWGQGTFPTDTYAAQQAIGIYQEGGTGYVGQVLSGRSVALGAGPFQGSVAGLSAASKTLCLINSAGSRRVNPPLATEPQQGNFGTIAYFNAAAVEQSPLVRSNVFRCSTDSIFCGYVATPIHQLSAIERFRRALPVGFDGVDHLGFGGAMLYANTLDAPTLAAYVANLTRGNPLVSMITLGVNDRANSTMTAAAFQTALLAVVDGCLATASFTGRLLLFSPIITATSEGPNGVGSTMAQYRATYSAVNALRPARTDYIDGSAVVSVGNLAADGIHALNAGQTEMLNALNAMYPTAPARS